MDDVLIRLTDLIITENNSDLVSDVVTGLSGKTISLADVMQSLGNLATSKSSNDRHTCLSILHKILDQVPESCISDQEADILTVFACQRLSCENDLIPLILVVIHDLCHRKTISDSSTTMIFTTLCKEISVPQQRIDDRFHVYQIIHQLSDKNFSALTRDPFDFLINFLQVLEGERDPRCLLLRFRLFSSIIPHVQLGHLDEDAFESVSVYFPIDYSPPVHDPHAVTKSDLVNGLAACFRASDKFGAPFYQLVAEKITSERRDSKLDCYGAIAECAVFYGAEYLKPFMSIIWTCIRTDVIKVENRDEDLQSAACRALTAIIETMNDDEDLHHLLEEIEQDLRSALTKQDLNLRTGAVNLLTAAAKTGKSYVFFENKTITHLMQSMAFNASRINAMEVHDMLIQFYSVEFHEFAQTDKLKNTPIVVSLCLTDTDEKELISRKLRLLYSIVKLRIKLDDNSSESVDKFITEIVIDQSRSVHQMHSSILALLIDQERTQISPSLVQLLSSSDPARMIALLGDVSISKELSAAYLKASIERLQRDDDPKARDLLSLVSSKLRQYQELLLKTVKDLMKDGELAASCILLHHLDTLHASKFMQFLHDQKKETIDVETFMKILSSITVPVSLSEWEVGDLIGRWCLSSDESVVHPLICCIAAKCVEDNVRDMLTEFVTDRKSIPCAACLTKGLAWTGKPFSQILELILKSFLTDDSEAAANAVMQLHEPESCLDLFPKSNFYHQKIFFSCLPRLSPLLHSSISDQQKADVKKAMLGQLRFLPENVIRSDLRKIHPLIINSISVTSSPDDTSDDVQSVALDCLKHLLQDNAVSNLIRNNLYGILKSLITLSTCAKLTDRRNALNCLSMIARSLPEAVLLTQRNLVLKSLKECVKDKKRIVRYAAADAVLKWVLVGQPGNEFDAAA